MCHRSYRQPSPSIGFDRLLTMPMMATQERSGHVFFATACSGSASLNSTALTTAPSNITDGQELGGAAVGRVSFSARAVVPDSGQTDSREQRPHVQCRSTHLVDTPILAENDKTTAGEGTLTHATGNRATALGADQAIINALSGTLESTLSNASSTMPCRC